MQQSSNKTIRDKDAEQKSRGKRREELLATWAQRATAHLCEWIGTKHWETMTARLWRATVTYNRPQTAAHGCLYSHLCALRLPAKTHNPPQTVLVGRAVAFIRCCSFAFWITLELMWGEKKWNISQHPKPPVCLCSWGKKKTRGKVMARILTRRCLLSPLLCRWLVIYIIELIVSCCAAVAGYIFFISEKPPRQLWWRAQRKCCPLWCRPVLTDKQTRAHINTLAESRRLLKAPRWLPATSFTSPLPFPSLYLSMSNFSLWFSESFFFSPSPLSEVVLVLFSHPLTLQDTCCCWLLLLEKHVFWKAKEHLSCAQLEQITE